MPRAGSLSRLRLAEEEIPPPAPGEVQVRVHAVGLNFADVFACLGLYSATPPGEFIPGLEFSGVVERPAEAPHANAGPPPAPGQRVMGVIRFGGYATRVNADAGRLRPIPDGWSYAEAAAFGVQTLTAWYALAELGAVKKGQAVLVQSAAGGVGLQALAILEQLGAVAVAVVGDASKRDFLTHHRGLDARQVLVRDRRGFGKQLDAALAWLGREGFDLVLESVAGAFFEPAYQRLARGGRMIVFGAADLMPSGVRPNYLKLGWRYLNRTRLDPLQMIAENRSVMGFNLIWLWDRIELLADMFDRISPMLPQPPWVGRVFPFSEAPEALRFLQSGRSVGKVVLEVA